MARDDDDRVEDPLGKSDRVAIDPGARRVPDLAAGIDDARRGLLMVDAFLERVRGDDVPADLLDVIDGHLEEIKDACADGWPNLWEAIAGASTPGGAPIETFDELWEALRARDTREGGLQTCIRLEAVRDRREFVAFCTPSGTREDAGWVAFVQEVTVEDDGDAESGPHVSTTWHDRGMLDLGIPGPSWERPEVVREHLNAALDRMVAEEAFGVRGAPTDDPRGHAIIPRLMGLEMELKALERPSAFGKFPGDAAQDIADGLAATQDLLMRLLACLVDHHGRS